MSGLRGRAAAREADRGRLLGILRDFHEFGRAIPCMSGRVERRYLWTSDEPDQANLAARLCVPCPAVADCKAFIDAYPDEAGVYAGSTEDDRRVRRELVSSLSVEVAGSPALSTRQIAPALGVTQKTVVLDRQVIHPVSPPPEPGPLPPFDPATGELLDDGPAPTVAATGEAVA